MHNRFIIGVVAVVGSLTLVFEAIGAESPQRNSPTTSPDFSGYFFSSEAKLVLTAGGRRATVGGKLGALLTEGCVAQLRKDYDRAISFFTAALQANQDKNVAFVIYSSRSSAYYEKGELAKALSDSTAAIQLYPKSALAYFERGHVYRELGDNDKAINDYTVAIQLNPKHERAYYNRALVYRNNRQYALAIRDSTMGIQLKPRDADAHHNRGVYHFETGAFDKAISDFGQAMRFDPRDARTLSSLAWLKATCPESSLRNGKEAIRMSMRACELSKWKEPDYIEALAAAHSEVGDYDQAVKYQTQAMRMKSA